MTLCLPPRFSGGVLTPVSGGLTNQSYRLDLQGETFFLRQGTPMAARLGIRRQREQTLHHIAAQHGMAPLLHYAAPERGLLITDWVAPCQPQRDWSDDAALIQLGTRIAGLHGIPVTVPSLQLDLKAHIHFYLARICLRERALMQLVERGLDCLTCLPVFTPVFCHNDIHADNVLGDAMLLVDWEYASVGDGAFDLAVVCRMFELDAGRQQRLLQAYWDAGGRISAERVTAMLLVADVMAMLWARVFWEATADARFDSLYQRLLARW